MHLAFLHAFKIFTETGIKVVGNELGPASVLDAALSVHEPLGDVVIVGLGDDVINFVHFLEGELSCSAVNVDLSNFAGEGSESPSYTLDDSQGKGNFVLSVHVRVLHTKNVLKVVGFSQNERRLQTQKNSYYQLH